MIKPNSIRNQCWVYRAEYRVIGNGSLQFGRSNNYPYNEHVRDCDICLAAQAVESLQADVDELKTDLHYCNGVSDLAMKHRDIAEAEVKRLKEYRKACDNYLILIRCKKCSGLVMDGYCCPHCGDSNPSEPTEKDDE